MRTSVLPCLVFLFAANLTLSQTIDTVVTKELKTYYEKGKTPPWADAIKNLTAEAPAQQATAAKYLVALLDQAQSDELSGKAPWRATPFCASTLLTNWQRRRRPPRRWR
jgi:hypothetical protein